MDAATLAVKQQGKDNLAPTQLHRGVRRSAYAVLSTRSGAYLGRFDASLALLGAVGDAPWMPSTYIVVSGTEVFVQDGAGNILILNRDDLKEKKRNG